MNPVNTMSIIRHLKTHLLITLITGSTGAAWGADSPSGDWAQWRGPHRDGHSKSTGLLSQWPEGGPRLRWKTDGLGLGYANIAVAGSQIYTMGDLDGECRLVVLNRENGEILWTRRVGKPGSLGWGNFEGPRSTPTVRDGKVYALGQHGELVCFDAENGREIWRKHLVEDLNGKVPEWGYSESVLVDEGRVICTPGSQEGTLAALDADTGAVVWRTEDFTDGAQYSSIIAPVIHGQKQYVQLTMEHLVGIDPRTGNILWKAEREGKTAVIPTPIHSNNHVFVTSGYGVGCSLFQIVSQGGKFEAREVYQNRDMKNHHGGVILVGDYIYGSSDPGLITCMNFKTGEVAWDDRSIGKGSLGYADGHLYLRSEKGKGTVALIAATPDGCFEKARFDPPHRSDKNAWTHPVILNDSLYLRDQGVLLCYDVGVTDTASIR